MYLGLFSAGEATWEEEEEPGGEATLNHVAYFLFGFSGLD